MTSEHNRANQNNVLLITVREDDDSVYEEGREALESLDYGESVDQPHCVTFPTEAQLARTFNERTLELLRVVTDAEPESIRETSCAVDRDVNTVHEELIHLEAMGVIQFRDENGSKRPVFPYNELVVD